MSNTSTALLLKLLAAEAEKLAHDYQNGRMWEGDLQRGIGRLGGYLAELQQSARDDL